MRLASVLALVACCTLAPALPAQGIKLSRVQFGTEVIGKKPSVADMSGKIVLVEAWGVN